MIRRLDYHGALGDRTELAHALGGAGLCGAAARTKASLFAQAAYAVRRRGRGHGFRAFYVPGRIEVLGKHTDYAGGASMLAAAERGLCLVMRPREGPHVTVTDASWRETVQFDLDPELVPRAGHWSNYPMTVARRLARNFPDARRGADIAFASDLPPAAGMSSSSAMIVAMFLALADANELYDFGTFRNNIHSLTDLAGYLSTVENGQSFGALAGDLGVGTIGGSEDHTAILCCQPRLLSEYSYCPIRFRRSLPMPEGFAFAVGSCGVAAAKTGEAMEKYNRASGLARKAAELWRRETGRDDPHLAAALASSPEAAGRIARIIESSHLDDPAMSRDALMARFEHFLTENEQLRPAAGDALASRDLEGLGRCVDRSQRLAEQLLGNQIPETCYLAASARERGAVAAIYFGAGFGGSVWAMVETSRVDAFLADWADAYHRRFPEHAANSLFFATGAGPAAFQLG